MSKITSTSGKVIVAFMLVVRWAAAAAMFAFLGWVLFLFFEGVGVILGLILVLVWVLLFIPMYIGMRLLAKRFMKWQAARAEHDVEEYRRRVRARSGGSSPPNSKRKP